MKLRLMLLFINYFIRISGELNEQEENMLTDFLSYLKIKNCIFLQKKIQPSILKKFSAANIYAKVAVEPFNPLLTITQQKMTVLSQTTVNLPTVKKFFSGLRKVS